MSRNEARWVKRLSNFNKAFAKLEEAIQKVKNEYKIDDQGNINDDSFLDDIIKEGIIQRFDYTHELAWNVMKDFLTEIGNVQIFGSKDATKEAFQAELINAGDVWMDMIMSRNKTSHTYNEETADDIFFKIINEYYPEFKAFKSRMEALKNEDPGDRHEII